MRLSVLLLVAVAFGQGKPVEFDGQVTAITPTHGPFQHYSVGSTWVRRWPQGGFDR
jgi:hypothetical protein